MLNAEQLVTGLRRLQATLTDPQRYETLVMAQLAAAMRAAAASIGDPAVMLDTLQRLRNEGLLGTAAHAAMVEVVGELIVQSAFGVVGITSGGSEASFPLAFATNFACESFTVHLQSAAPRASDVTVQCNKARLQHNAPGYPYIACSAGFPL